jgi:alpha-amylase
LKMFARKLPLILCLCLLVSVGSIGFESQLSSASTAINGTLFQYFEWHTPDDGEHWNRLNQDAANLKNVGITAVWLPPTSKGRNSSDVGYGIYDAYDLGEFDQKGTIRTKYGTKAQLIGAVDSLHANGLHVYGDVVMNHRMWADATEIVGAVEVDGNDRNKEITGQYDIEAWTQFNYEGRNGTYSTFKWNASHFDGVDWDQKQQKNAIFKFKGLSKSWDWEVDTENGNYDYLMGADIDWDNAEVQSELRNWGKWYADTLKLDGVRLDAVKHIKFTGMRDWLNNLRADTGKSNLFAVGEYWSGDLNKLNNYLTAVNGNMSLFDVPLHYNLYHAGNSRGRYDMRTLFDNTLMMNNPTKAVTFVDNHDSQPGQALESTISEWFKPTAYAAILTREQGYPMVFYGDYYGTNDGKISSHKAVIDKLLKARTQYAYGTQRDYFDHGDIIGWTREGNATAKSGLATIATDGNGGSKWMYVGTANSGETWIDLTGIRRDKVTINADGWGEFFVNRKSVSVYVQQ